VHFLNGIRGQMRGGVHYLRHKAEMWRYWRDIQNENLAAEILNVYKFKPIVIFYAATPPIARPLMFVLRMSTAPSEPSAPHATATRKTLSTA